MIGQLSVPGARPAFGSDAGRLAAAIAALPVGHPGWRGTTRYRRGAPRERLAGPETSGERSDRHAGRLPLIAGLPSRSRTQDFRLLGLEFGVGEDALGFQFRELLQLGDGVPGRRRRRRRWLLRILLFFLPAQRLACLRDTRFDTAVAVPAMTAVRATPRRSPGMVLSFLAGSAVGCVEGRGDGVLRDVSGGYQFRVTSAQRLDEGCCPAVLEDQDAGRRARLDH